jgi:Protein of unknown function (DUF3800)
MCRMYLAYVDDSGDSKHGTTLTALLVEPHHWAGLLDAWLTGRREVHQQFGVRKHAELHATALYKGRGRFCETAEEEKRFGTGLRAATGRIVLSHLSRFDHFYVLTVGSQVVSKPTLYAMFVAHLEDWAAAMETQLMIFYDGQQGLPHHGADPTPQERAELWDRAVPDATPYRQVHRGLDITSRRVVEDVIMQDSRYSQLIQAVDLIAYGAYQHHRQHHPEIWGTDVKPVADAIRAYMTTKAHWVHAEDSGGVAWLSA